jgi:hypothetical protein
MKHGHTHLIIWGFYLLVALAITWPLVAQLSTHLVGWSYGDSHEMARHIWWYNHALRTGQSVFWQPALGYPDGMEGVLLWAHPQQFFPAWLLAFALPIPAAANLSILFYMALNGWAMYVLAAELLAGRRGPALLAGLAFMAAPTFQGHLGGGHAGLIVAWPVPLYILALLRLGDIRPPAENAVGAGAGRGRVQWFLLAVLFFVLSPGGHILQLIYVLLPISGFFALVYLGRRDTAALLRLIAVNLLGSALLLVFLLPIVRSTLDTPAYTDEGGFVRYSADLLSVVAPSFFHPLYAGLAYPRQVFGTNLEEGISYIGIIGGGLALLGVLVFRQARVWLLLALIAWVLSLGPLLKVLDVPVTVQPDGYASYVTLPFAVLQNLPGFDLARTPGRFNFVLALTVALLAGYGAAWLWDHGRAGLLRAGLLALLGAGLLADFQVYWPLPTHTAAVPQAVYALAQRDDIRAVLNLPWDNPVAAKDALYLQTAHQQPLVAGHVTRSTPVSPSKLALLEQTLDPALLDAAGADIVILHKAYLTSEQLQDAVSWLGAPLYEDADLMILEPPPPAQGPSFHTIAEPAAIERYADLYAYAPQAGWVTLSGRLSGTGQTLALLRDQTVIHRWQVADEQDFRIQIPVESDSYHVIRLALEPPCPVPPHPALICDAVRLQAPILDAYTPEPMEPIVFAQGVTLQRGALPTAAAPGAVIQIPLWWVFEAARRDTDIRFIHLVSETGELITQDDSPLGALPAGSQWVEQVSLSLPETLPAGEYAVYIGWYTYPDFARFPVLSDRIGAADGWALLGRLRIE